MAKNLKLKIKNAQLAEALQLDKLKKKKSEETAAKKKAVSRKKAAKPKEPETKIVEEEPIAETPKEEPKTEVVKPPAVKTPEPEAPPTEEGSAKAPPAEKPKPAVVVDDFKRPKIVRKAPSPPKKLPATRKDAPKRPAAAEKEGADKAKGGKETPRKTTLFKDYRDVRTERKPAPSRGFDARDRRGLSAGDEDRWRKRRPRRKMPAAQREELTIRPKELTVRLPITVKDLAAEMKLKSSQLISKLFLQGVAVTINDILDDETTVQLLGQEFDCEISIDTSEEERIQITGKTIREEIQETDSKSLILRPPVITFMGHVDHGKTSLIDAIRKTNTAEGEAGAITQHIGAFKCQSDAGEITILDTPGHEAFTAMRERGADVTDLVVLVIAGDEGMRDQTVEAMNMAKEAKVPILVAINKSDKAGFDPENIYRQLSEHELLPEAWGGETITVNCSATTGDGIKDLLEMLALQAEVLELQANPATRARGSVIESAMHKGLGSVATVLVQNGTLRLGDCLVIDLHYARVKTLHDEFGKSLSQAGPSTPIKLTGLSDLPEAGSEFIVVESEKEAREISSARLSEYRHKQMQKRKRSIEGFIEGEAPQEEKKVLHVLLRADVQGSVEALKHSLQKIKSDKAELNIVSEEVGQISESDIELAAASGATILGFHTKVESHAESMVNEKKVDIILHDIIYHAVDDIKEKMRRLLDKIAEENDMGAAEVKAVFKSSQLGLIAGCQVTEGLIKRSHHARLRRDGEVIWKGQIASLKRGKDDIKEVSKDLECGILLEGFKQFQEGDLIESYEITYLEQEL